MDQINNEIVHNGEVVSHLNLRLIEQKGLDQAQVDEIKAAHVQCLSLEDAFEAGKISANEYREDWAGLQFKLQKLWGFEENSAFHRFWYMKGCTCPKIDNDDRYPSDAYVISRECPVHGGWLESTTT